MGGLNPPNTPLATPLSANVSYPRSIAQLRQAVRSVSVDAANTVVISLRLDYCKSLLYGISDSDILLGRLQADRLLQHSWSLAPEGVTKSPRSCSNTDYHCDSDWNVSSYKALAPPYRSDDCQLVATTGRRQHRSSDNFKRSHHHHQHQWIYSAPITI